MEISCQIRVFAIVTAKMLSKCSWKTLISRDRFDILSEKSHSCVAELKYKIRYGKNVRLVKSEPCSVGLYGYVVREELGYLE